MTNEPNNSLLDKYLYKNEPSVLERYISLTTQKQALVKNVIDKLVNKYDFSNKKKFTFIDIGCSDGLVTIPIIKRLEEYIDDINLICIEESEKSIKEFKNRYNGEVTLINKNAESMENLPNADFILMAHLFWFIDDIGSFLDKTYSALSSEGTALIVLNNKESQGAKINNPTGSDNLLLSSNVQDKIKEKGINFEVETVKSEINVSSLKDMNKNGKAIISFFKHKNFEEIPKDQVEDLRQRMLKASNKKNNLKKIEDYIWIYK